VQEESAQAQEGAQQPSDRLEKRSGPLVFTSRSSRRSAQKNGSDRWILIKYPSAVRSDRRCTRVNPSHSQVKVPTEAFGIGISTFGISGVSRSGDRDISWKSPGNDLDRPFVETRGGDRATHRYIGYRGFETEISVIGHRKSEIARIIFRSSEIGRSSRKKSI
jgi:hypothetical protein